MKKLSKCCCLALAIILIVGIVPVNALESQIGITHNENDGGSGLVVNEATPDNPGTPSETDDPDVTPSPEAGDPDATPETTPSPETGDPDATPETTPSPETGDPDATPETTPSPETGDPDATPETKSVTVRFFDTYAGVQIGETLMLKSGDEIVYPSLPSHDGVQMGWEDGSATVVPEFSSEDEDLMAITINAVCISFRVIATLEANGSEELIWHTANETLSLPEVPDQYATEDYQYAWYVKGVDGSLTPADGITVTAPMEIIAKFKYKVTFYNVLDDIAIEEKWAKHNNTVNFPDLPQKDGILFKWDTDAETPITEPMTINAFADQYKVTFIDQHAGTIVSEQWVGHDGNAAAPDLPYTEADGYRYEWDNDFTNVKSPLTVTANFTYRVRFVNGHNGEIASEQWIRRGNDAVAPALPYTEADGYHYTWDKNYTNVMDTMVVTAKFTYRVQFVNEHTGETVSEQWIEYGSDATAPDLPYTEVDGYRYAWDRDFTNINDTMVVTARFTYRVRFIDQHKDEIVSEQWIEYSSDATAPDLPYTDGYRYAWDKNYTNVMDTMVVTARFTYRVQFVNEHTGETVSEQWIAHGSDATAPDLPYTKDDGYRYAWDKECTNVTDTMVITARFTYRVSFIDGFENTTLDERWIKHGEATEIPEAPYHEGFHLALWYCDDDGPTQDSCAHVDRVCKPLEVTALYEAHRYTVTLKWSSCGTVDPGMEIGEGGVLEGLEYSDKITLNMSPDNGHHVWYITINGEIAAVYPGNTYEVDLLSDVDGDTYDIFVMFKTDAPEAEVPLQEPETAPGKPPKTDAASMTAFAVMAILSGAGIMLTRRK